MDLFWIVITFVLVLLALFVWLPKMFDGPTQAYAIQKRDGVSVQRQQQITEDNRRMVEARQSEAQLDQVFEATRARDVPMDFPPQQVGACPYSKAHSRDLPIVNMPMSMVSSANNMYLSI